MLLQQLQIIIKERLIELWRQYVFRNLVGRFFVCKKLGGAVVENSENGPPD